MNSKIFTIFPFFVLCHSLPFSLREFEAKYRVFTEPEKQNGECSVTGYSAGCCQHVEIDEVKLNSTVCVNLTYLPTDYGLSFTLTIDGKAYINETVSARNPPALCAELPYTKELASICLKFYNLDFSNSTFSGCSKVIIDLAYVTIAEYVLGCFKIPSGGQRSGLAPDTQMSTFIEEILAKEHVNPYIIQKKVNDKQEPNIFVL